MALFGSPFLDTWLTFHRLPPLSRLMGFEDPFEDVPHELVHPAVALRDASLSSSSSGSLIKEAGGDAKQDAHALTDLSNQGHQDLMTAMVRAPAVDVLERDNDYVINVDVPGVAKEDLKVHVTEEGRRGRKRKLLTVSGERKDEDFKEDKEHGVRSSVRRYGKFSRSLVLPENCNAEHAQIKAKHNNGVLKVTLPKVKTEPPLKRQAIDVPIA